MLLRPSVRSVVTIALFSGAISSAGFGGATSAQAHTQNLLIQPSFNADVIHPQGKQEAESLAQTLSFIQQGMAQVNAGELETAIQHFNQAIGLSREINEPYWEGISLLARGQALLDLGQSALGLESVQQGLAIAQEIGDPQMEAIAQEILSAAQETLNEAEAE